MVPAGYADGLDRRLEGRGAALVRGRRAPIVGAVSMDMLTVDVTGIDGVGPGDEVVFLGAQGEASWQRIDAREMAAWIGTIPYEVRVPAGRTGEAPLRLTPWRRRFVFASDRSCSRRAAARCRATAAACR